jgi:beta-fructofuranosidase
LLINCFAYILQADVDVTFSFSSLDKAEPFDPKWAKLDALDVCAQKGSKDPGGLGPFGLLTLASENLEEFTPVFFRVFKAADKHKVLLCSDARRFVLQLLFSSLDICSHPNFVINLY